VLPPQWTSLTRRMRTGTPRSPEAAPAGLQDGSEKSRRHHGREDEFTGERHVYEPHFVGLPPLRSYLREAWRRREFAVELSRTKLRAQHYDTLFGQLWLVLNPLMLAGVYFVLVDIIRRGERPEGYFAHLLGGIFAYYLVTGAIRDAVKSVTSGGRLILNSAFPRVLLPLASVVSAFKRFIPTMVIYVPVHIISGLPVDAALLWVVPLVALMIIMAAGFSMIVAAGQVYFRDLESFLPYLLRVWLYISPVLYYADEVPQRYQILLSINPLGQILSAWSDVINAGVAPSTKSLVIATAWAFGTLIAGFVFFVSREREFAVRL
jgi:teichoic acid transport system permease protein